MKNIKRVLSLLIVTMIILTSTLPSIASSDGDLSSMSMGLEVKKYNVLY